MTKGAGRVNLEGEVCWFGGHGRRTLEDSVVHIAQLLFQHL